MCATLALFIVGSECVNHVHRCTIVRTVQRRSRKHKNIIIIHNLLRSTDEAVIVNVLIKMSSSSFNVFPRSLELIDELQTR